MGPLATLLTLPVSGPMAGLTWIARQIAGAAMQELLDPTRIETALLALERRLEDGKIDEATFEAEEERLLAELAEITALRTAEAEPLSAGDRFRMPLVKGREADLHIVSLEPDGPGLLDDATVIEMAVPASGVAPEDGPRYEDLGGLSRVVERIREVVELPLRNRAVFAHLGISPPQGVLLVGPPDTGKTMIARAVAAGEQGAFPDDQRAGDCR